MSADCKPHCCSCPARVHVVYSTEAGSAPVAAAGADGSQHRSLHILLGFGVNNFARALEAHLLNTPLRTLAAFLQSSTIRWNRRKRAGFMYVDENLYLDVHENSCSTSLYKI